MNYIPAERTGLRDLWGSATLKLAGNYEQLKSSYKGEPRIPKEQVTPDGSVLFETLPRGL